MKTIVKLVPEQNSYVMCLFANVCKFIAKVRSIWFLEESAPAIFPSRTQAPEQFSRLNMQVRKDHHHSILHHCVALSVLSVITTHTTEITGILMIQAWTINCCHCCPPFSSHPNAVTCQPQALAMLLGCCSQQKPKNKSCTKWCAVGNLSRAQHFWILLESFGLAGQSRTKVQIWHHRGVSLVPHNFQFGSRFRMIQRPQIWDLTQAYSAAIAFINTMKAWSVCYPQCPHQRKMWGKCTLQVFASLAQHRSLSDLKLGLKRLL